MSLHIKLRPSFLAAIAVVPFPTKQSMIIFPGLELAFMILSIISKGFGVICGNF